MGASGCVYRVVARSFTGRPEDRIMTQRSSGHLAAQRSVRHARIGLVAVLAAALAVTACSSPTSPTGSAPAASQTPSASYTPDLTPAVAAVPSTLPAGVLAIIPLQLGAAPFAVTAGFGSIWVPTHRANNLYRINVRTNRVAATIDVGEECDRPFLGFGLVFTCSDSSADVNPASNQVVATHGGGFAVVDGVPWGAGPLSLVRLDPKTWKVTRTVHVDANPRHVSDPDTVATFGDGAFWVINWGDDDGIFGGALVKVDARTGRILHVYQPPDPGGAADIQFADHAVWIKGDDSGRLVKLDARTGRTTVYNLPGFQSPSDWNIVGIGLGMDDLWIRVSSGVVLRFDPATGRVVGHYPADPNSGGGFVTVYDGSLWEANFDTDTVWRVRIT
jgi:streptogramin lyase